MSVLLDQLCDLNRIQFWFYWVGSGETVLFKIHEKNILTLIHREIMYVKPVHFTTNDMFDSLKILIWHWALPG